MIDIPKVRFNALAGYCRGRFAATTADEVRWLSAHDEAILVVVARDWTDGDFLTMLLARDLKERYRFVAMTEFVESADAALAAAAPLVESTFADLQAQRVQGDEDGEPMDFFAPRVAPGKLNPHFAKITTLRGYSSAVELMKPMMRWYEDADGNFVEQFQSTGFDARLWELYIFATMVEAGYVFEKANAMPDFCAKNALGQLFVEATTINPAKDQAGNIILPPPTDTPEQVRFYNEDFLPTRFARRLKDKLKKKYWEQEHVSGHPLVFAIQDFHAPMSMLMSRSALTMYLYGTVWDDSRDKNDALVITSRKVEDQHGWGPGFFSLPGAEHVSAVISNSSATISKFNRMGRQAGFGATDIRMVRKGLAVDINPNSNHPLPFAYEVGSTTHEETWIEGMDVFHNPKALHPLDPMMLPGAAHHRVREDGLLESMVPHFQPFSSTTTMLEGVAELPVDQ